MTSGGMSERNKEAAILRLAVLEMRAAWAELPDDDASGNAARLWDAADAIEALARSKEHCTCPACADGVIHASDCAVHNEPAMPNGPCTCGVLTRIRDIERELQGVRL